MATCSEGTTYTRTCMYINAHVCSKYTNIVKTFPTSDGTYLLFSASSSEVATHLVLAGL